MEEQTRITALATNIIEYNPYRHPVAFMIYDMIQRDAHEHYSLWLISIELDSACNAASK